MNRANVFLLAAWCCAATALEYPETRRVDVVDHYHGINVTDPYRWLENADSEETADWVKSQNKLSLPFLKNLPGRDAYQQRLTQLWNYERYSVPVKQAGAYFFTRNDGLQNQAVLYVRTQRDAPPRVVLDPNKLSADGTVALTQWEVSPDGQWLAYGVAAAGSDWNEFRVLDVATGKNTGDTLSRIKFSNLSWTKDGKGFFYSRYPPPPIIAQAGVKETAPATVFDELSNQKLYYHRLGEPQSADRLILERPDQPQWFFSGNVSQDGQFLFISVARGSGNENALYYLYLGDPKAPKLDGKLAALVEGFTASYVPVTNEGSVVYLLTDKSAPRKRIVAVDLRNPSPKHWATLIAETGDTIDSALHVNRELVLLYLHDASHRLIRHSLDGQAIGDLPLPELGSVPDLNNVKQLKGNRGDSELFYSFTSFNRPPTTYRCELPRGPGAMTIQQEPGRGRCAVFQSPKLAFNPDDFVTTQVFYRSKDGTRVPMFISHKKGLKKSDSAPVYLFGYGGFEISKLPEFDEKYGVSNLIWMEQGGIFALANLRGGGEYGQAWHKAGTLERKQNVFDDFIAAGEYLVKSGYTKPQQLAIGGRSNGGLLVGAVLNQRPDLFAAGIPMVGVMDMLRYHKFTIGWAWAGDYGTSDEVKGFKYLSAYSPYHNIRTGTKYPAVLVTTADHDDRVVPGHSFKYTAALQAAQAGDNPVLIRVDVKAGHGATGKPISKIIEEEADKLAFLTRYTQAPP